VRLPRWVIHADWGTAPDKRWAAVATLAGDRYAVAAPRITLDPLREAIRRREPALVGFDFPIGIPLAYARKANVDGFLELLPRLGWGDWRNFFLPASFPEEVSLERPFYPRRPGGTSHQHLLDGLGFESMNQLRRRCELRHDHRGAAEVIFWTLGPKQVGRAAIAGWRDMLIPAMSEISIWPFQGDLDALCDRVVVVETYPAEFYGHLGLPASKTASARASAAPALMTAAERLGVDLPGDLLGPIRLGFANDDAYDAFVGVLGMINVLRGNRQEAPALDADTRRIEGWILGQG
jgi:hypothetical protein